ncbi:uncharacterized protein Y057_351 [Fusarium fujikuroi]|nr:uncharacterized protein Y057_351 [Fusarium fujikuroi]
MKPDSDSDYENGALSLVCIKRNDYGEVGERAKTSAAVSDWF